MRVVRRLGTDGNPLGRFLRRRPLLKVLGSASMNGRNDWLLHFALDYFSRLT